MDTKKDELTVKELRFWLMSDEPEAVQFRLNPDNETAIGTMASRLASEPGGVARTVITNRLSQERKTAAAVQREKERLAAFHNQIKDAALEEHLMNGGTHETFHRSWSSTKLQKLIETGEGRELVERQARRRLARSASTW